MAASATAAAEWGKHGVPALPTPWPVAGAPAPHGRRSILPGIRRGSHIPRGCRRRPGRPRNDRPRARTPRQGPPPPRPPRRRQVGRRLHRGWHLHVRGRPGLSRAGRRVDPASQRETVADARDPVLPRPPHANAPGAARTSPQWLGDADRVPKRRRPPPALWRAALRALRTARLLLRRGLRPRVMRRGDGSRFRGGHCRLPRDRAAVRCVRRAHARLVPRLGEPAPARRPGRRGSGGRRRRRRAVPGDEPADRAGERAAAADGEGVSRLGRPESFRRGGRSPSSTSSPRLAMAPRRSSPGAGATTSWRRWWRGSE